MKQWSNFYFWSSWILLGCLFFMIFYLYQRQFNILEKDFINSILTYVVDIKTILTVLGTIFGAYFGAKTAGKYAVLSVEKQIDAQEKKEKANQQEILHGTLSLYVTYLTSIETYSRTLLEDFKITEHSKFENKNASYLKFIKKEIETFQERLNRVDTSNIYTNNPGFFLLPIIVVENLVVSIDNLLENLEDSHEQRYKAQYAHFQEAFNEMRENRDSILSMLSKEK